VQLFAQHEHEIYACIVAVLGNWADADEVMQETSMALWEMFDEFQPGTNFRAWACAIARHRIQRFRQKQARDRHVFSDEFIEAVSQTAQEEAERFESRRKALAQCVDKLAQQDRRLLQLCYAGSESFKHVAEQLGRPVSGVYKALWRIRQALFDCINRTLAADEV
jgi:RNA polymerase sigma-70 factor (ECF subfamily)